MVDFMTETKNIQDEPGVSYSTRKLKKKKKIKPQQREYVKGAQDTIKRASNSQSWDNLSNKIK